MSLTTDRNSPCLNKTKENGQNECYLVLSQEELDKGFVRPVRHTYIHNTCGAATTMGTTIAETYAAQPSFYSHTFCVGCKKHLPVGEFKWEDGSTLGS